MDLVAGFTAHLCRRGKARLVSLFADDARLAGGAFHLYYVFALDAAHGFIILRVPVPSGSTGVCLADQRGSRRQLAGT